MVSTWPARTTADQGAFGATRSSSTTVPGARLSAQSSGEPGAYAAPTGTLERTLPPVTVGYDGVPPRPSEWPAAMAGPVLIGSGFVTALAPLGSRRCSGRHGAARVSR